MAKLEYIASFDKEKLVKDIVDRMCEMYKKFSDQKMDYSFVMKEAREVINFMVGLGNYAIYQGLIRYSIERLLENEKIKGEISPH